MSSRPSRSGSGAGRAPRRWSSWAAAGVAAIGLALSLAAMAVLSAGDAPPGLPPAQAATPEPIAIADEASHLERAAGRLDEGEAIHRLAQAFEVTGQQIVDLLEQKMGLGDTAAALAVAQAARKPVNTVLAL